MLKCLQILYGSFIYKIHRTVADPVPEPAPARGRLPAAGDHGLLDLGDRSPDRVLLPVLLHPDIPEVLQDDSGAVPAE